MAEKTETNPKGAGAPLGHTNSNKNNRIWGNIIKKYAVQEDYKRLHALAEKLYEKAAEGDLAAIKEVGSAGLAKTVFPATNAATTCPIKIASGKFHGLIQAIGPRPT